MTLRVPHWDVTNGSEIEFAPADLSTLSKGKLDQRAPDARATLSFAAAEPNHELDRVGWLEQQEFTMQSRDGRGANRSVWTQGSSSWMPDCAAGNGSGSPRTDPVNNDGTLDAILNEAVHAVDVPVRHPAFQEDELLSWLQYPMDDILDRGYCSDLFGDLPNSNVQIVKHSFNQLGLKPQEASLGAPGSGFRGILPLNPGISGLNGRCTTSPNRGVTESCGSDALEAKNRVAGADAAMAVRAGRAVGLTSQSGGEVFSKVRATTQPSLAKFSHGSSPSANCKSLDMEPFVSHPPNEEASSQPHNSLGAYATAPLPTLKPLDTASFSTSPSPPGRLGTRNFSNFSRPVAETKASLQLLGAGSGLTNLERVRQSVGSSARLELNVKETSLEESIITVSSGLVSYVPQIHVEEVSQSDGTCGRWQLPPISSCGNEGNLRKGNVMCGDNVFNSSMGNSGVTAAEKGAEPLETADQTATSPSRGSGNSTEKSGKEAGTTSKRKFSGGDDSEYQSEDVEEFAMNNKKPPLGAKRSRAAEIHNQSERRRRDRINEKMKALQELIPNSIKSDKASMLDEVIEYLKLLQSQLQTMSVRTGIGIPPSMMPNVGMQHLQMPTLPHMGLGMGMGMGVGLGMGMGMSMGMGLMDVNAAAAAAAGRTMVSLPPFPGQTSVGPASYAAGLQACPPSLSMVETHAHLQSSNIMDPYNVYLAHQQVQPAALNLNMHRNVELYNTYMMQQQQQQWQLQLQQSQQAQGNNGSKPV